MSVNHRFVDFATNLGLNHLHVGEKKIAIKPIHENYTLPIV